MAQGAQNGISPALRYSIYIFSMLLLLFILFQRYNFIKLTDEYDDYKSYAEELVANLTTSVTQLEEQNEALQTIVESLTTENTALSESYDLLQEDVDATIQTITSYEQEIAESMEWFNENADLSAVGDNADLMEMSIEHCYDRELTSCVIKMGCFYLTNAEKLSITYQQDEITSGALDKLQSLADFYDNKGGDCEDYALFYKAEYNHVLEQCNQYGKTDITVEAWIPTDDESRYWLDFKKSWFLNNATSVEFEDGYIYPNIVCGNIYDFNEQKISGHCIIAFTKEEIASENDIMLLDDALLIEPQNGRYMGRLNGDGGIALLTEQSAKTMTREDSYIYQVITDDDLLTYSEVYQRWLSYSGFQKALRDQKLSLYAMVGES